MRGPLRGPLSLSLRPSPRPSLREESARRKQGRPRCPSRCIIPLKDRILLSFETVCGSWQRPQPGAIRAARPPKKSPPFMQKDQAKGSFCLVCFICSPAPLKTGAARIGISGGPCKEPANATKPIFYFVAFAKIRKNKVYPLLFLPDPGELSKRKNRIPAQRGNKIAVLFRSRAWGGLYSVFGRLLPRDFQTSLILHHGAGKVKAFYRFPLPCARPPSPGGILAHTPRQAALEERYSWPSAARSTPPDSKS